LILRISFHLIDLIDQTNGYFKMSNGSMINNENRQSFTNLFNKFIRMTIKTDNRDKRLKKGNISRRSSKENENLLSSTHDYYQVSLISNENNNTYSYNDDNDQQDNYSDHVRNF